MAYYFIKNVQQDVCVIINDPTNEGYPLIGVNDTRNIQNGIVSVMDASSNRKIYESKFQIPANGKVQITSLPKDNEQGFYLIQYKIGNQTFTNHYLYGNAPFDLKKYRKWLLKNKINPLNIHNTYEKEYARN